jgi:hypothetical protein
VATINKSFGTVMCEGENLSHIMVAAGWAKVKTMGKGADHEELTRLEAQAQASGLGMWSTKPGAAAESIRTIIGPNQYDAKEVKDPPPPSRIPTPPHPNIPLSIQASSSKMMIAFSRL